MGETRVKKSKKASKQPQDADRPLQSSLEKMSLAGKQHNKSANVSQQSPAPTDIIEQPDAKDEDEGENQDLTADPSYITIINTESKGLAVFAARKIPAGTLVLADTPLIRLTQAEEDADKSSNTNTNTNTSSSDATSLTTQFHSLSKPLQKSYLTLFDSQKSSFPKLKSIYYSNCYNLTTTTTTTTTTSTNSSPGGSCIGLTASRLNHSCIPNVQFSFNESSNLMLFYAIKSIPKGKELTSTYDSVFEGGEQRRRRLMLYYGFWCGCEPCEPGESEFWGRSDERRKGMREVVRVVRECERRYCEEGGGDGRVEVVVAREAIDALVRLEGLLVKERLVGVPLVDVYRGLGRWAERAGDGKAVERWRRRELEVCVTCFGRGSARVAEVKRRGGVVK